MKHAKQLHATPRGFTLVELLISSVLILTVGMIMISVFFVSLRSTTKINTMHTIRQNGNYAIFQVGRMLQFAQQFEGVSTDGVTFTTACQLPSSGTLTQYKYVRMKAFDEGLTTFACQSPENTIASNSASLIDNTTLQTSACYFTCTQINTYSPQSIGISFTLNKKNPSNPLDDASPVHFETSVTFRNIN